ncbi:hypothetical protein GF337_04305 [candidate division KSB1 bacterium]|nr:hypothetical protein [candidate division KSB1 bacterium]
MKRITLFTVIMALAIGCRAQNIEDNKELNFMVIEPKSYEQKLLDSILEEYNVDESKKQVIIFCWGHLPADNYLLVDPPERFSRLNGIERNGLNRIDKSDKFAPKKLKLLQEIEEYKNAIHNSTKELKELQHERDMIVRKIKRLKKLLQQKGKIKLEREEEIGYEAKGKN